ncbi:hypothetical protein M0R45_006554 [Rubus argutus]|uniref:DRBM domain-containing protein n=1 Tax=Rubus argutus TaxID=59490 RepID=A0AAW1YRF9_RUBAR
MDPPNLPQPQNATAPSQHPTPILTQNQSPVPSTPTLTLNQAPVPSTSPSSSQSQCDQLVYKSRLVEYTQRSRIELPVYCTVNEGLPHIPKFRSSVLVNGTTYNSPNTFSLRKAAEQDAAKIAMADIEQKINEAVTRCLIYEDRVFCKAVLNEYAVKRSIERPSYNTVKPEGLIPIFRSTLVFNGVAYTGDTGSNKKEAEQLVAHAAILSLMDASVGMLAPHHEFLKRKPGELTSEATAHLPITFVPAVSEQPMGFVSTSPSLAVLRSKKRQKNKKSKKGLHTDVQLPIAAVPLMQPAPCSVAQ